MINDYLKNELFEGVISKQEFLIMHHKNKFNYDNLSLIAIHDPNKNSHDKSITDQFVSSLQIHFWDVLSIFGEYHPINNKQGRKIKQFIFDNFNNRFVIHCSAGISRSAAVAKAIEILKNKYLDKNYFGIDNHSRYSPNITVLKTILNANV